MESAAAKSIKISTKPEDTTHPDQARLEGKYGHHLSAMDLDGDGFLSRYEVLSFIERTVEAAKQLKLVKLLLGASLALLLLFSLASFGLTWAVVNLSKEVKADSGRLVDTATGETMRIARGLLTAQALPPTSLNVTDGATRQRLLEDLGKNCPSGRGIYVADANQTAVLEGCQLKADGYPAFSMELENEGEGEVALFDVAVKSARNCSGALLDENATGVRGTFELSGVLHYVDCPEDSDVCQLYECDTSVVDESSNSTVVVSEGGRRLLCDHDGCTPTTHQRDLL